MPSTRVLLHLATADRAVPGVVPIALPSRPGDARRASPAKEVRRADTMVATAMFYGSVSRVDACPAGLHARRGSISDLLVPDVRGGGATFAPVRTRVPSAGCRGTTAAMVVHEERTT